MEVDHLEENTAVEEKEGRSTLNYVTNPMKMYFGTLTILQRVLTNNWQLGCGVILETLTLLGLTLSAISSKPSDLCPDLLFSIFYNIYKYKNSITISYNCVQRMYATFFVKKKNESNLLSNNYLITVMEKGLVLNFDRI